MSSTKVLWGQTCVVLGIVLTNMRDRLIAIFLPDEGDFGDYDADPIDFIFENNLILAVLGGVVAIIVIVVVAFYVSWRFHTFRITGDAVEVRSGVLFRTHRRAPLDRVQGVNLTRPMIARLLGTAKLEVVGAGTDGMATWQVARYAKEQFPSRRMG